MHLSYYWWIIFKHAVECCQVWWTYGGGHSHLIFRKWLLPCSMCSWSILKTKYLLRRKTLVLSCILIEQTAALDGVRLWDLRKLRNFRSFAPYDQDTPTNSGMNHDFLTLNYQAALAGKQLIPPSSSSELHFELLLELYADTLEYCLHKHASLNDYHFFS